MRILTICSLVLLTIFLCVIIIRKGSVDVKIDCVADGVSFSLRLDSTKSFFKTISAGKVIIKDFNRFSIQCKDISLGSLMGVVGQKKLAWSKIGENIVLEIIPNTDNSKVSFERGSVNEILLDEGNSYIEFRHDSLGTSTIKIGNPHIICKLGLPTNFMLYADNCELNGINKNSLNNNTHYFSIMNDFGDEVSINSKNNFFTIILNDLVGRDIIRENAPIYSVRFRDIIMPDESSVYYASISFLNTNLDSIVVTNNQFINIDTTTIFKIKQFNLKQTGIHIRLEGNISLLEIGSDNKMPSLYKWYTNNSWQFNLGSIISVIFSFVYLLFSIYWKLKN